MSEMRPIITRSIQFSDGGTMTFSLKLPRDDGATLIDLHRQSIEDAIARLQEFLTPQSD
jgi:hypothetical protein